MLEGPPPAYTHCQSFQHRVIALLNVAMEDHPSAAITLANFEQDPSFATRLSLGSDAMRALNSLLDQRGVYL
jgi:hypothetical protein